MDATKYPDCEIEEGYECNSTLAPTVRPLSLPASPRPAVNSHNPDCTTTYLCRCHSPSFNTRDIYLTRHYRSAPSTSITYLCGGGDSGLSATPPPKKHRNNREKQSITADQGMRHSNHRNEHHREYHHHHRYLHLQCGR